MVYRGEMGYKNEGRLTKCAIFIKMGGIAPPTEAKPGVGAFAGISACGGWRRSFRR